jgi:hypothetical protein
MLLTLSLSGWHKIVVTQISGHPSVVLQRPSELPAPRAFCFAGYVTVFDSLRKKAASRVRVIATWREG